MKKTKSESKGLRITANILRIFLAVAFFLGGLSYFFSPAENMGFDPATKEGAFLLALSATGYFLPFLKVVETIVGLMLFSKRWTPLALIILAPIVVQIFLYDLFLQPAFIWMGLLFGAITAFLGWYNWVKFAPLFKA